MSFSREHFQLKLPISESKFHCCPKISRTSYPVQDNSIYSAPKNDAAW